MRSKNIFFYFCIMNGAKIKINRIILILTLTFTLCGAGQLATAQSKPNEEERIFDAAHGSFILEGKPFVIKAAELHYPRIPKEYWDQRIKLCKALGMNTICLYTFWNVHEPKEGEFDFSGQNDLREFIKLCEENGMKVILRPGPYVCAEWEMGGLPWWLLKKKDIRLRENDPYFLERVEAFQKEVANQVADLTVDNGGPILMVQVENEYGSYGEDKEYIANIRDILRKYFGNDVMLFQCDWSSNFTLNGLDDLLWTMNFGTGADINREFAVLKDLRPDSPLMCSEFWSGWFDKWGANHETRPASDMIAGIDEMLGKGISFSLYMTHGGTNWGHWAGANSPGYAPDVTSYDYDAPINESGQPTPKYWDLRETLAKYFDGDSLPQLPELITPIAVEKFSLSEVAPLFSNLPAPIEVKGIMTMEEFDQGFGSILYSTELPEVSSPGLLKVNEVHDYAIVFLNGRQIGTIDRRLGENEVILNSCPEGSRIDILVEATGRINFGRSIKDFKGITESVIIEYSVEGRKKTVELNDWKVYLLPDELEFYTGMKFGEIDGTRIEETGRLAPGVYRGSFNIDKPSDTFLNFESWGKGLVYVNGHPLGRIWHIGPQQTLYTPGPWLKEGENEILVFDIVGPENVSVEGLMDPILDKLQLPYDNKANEGLRLDLSYYVPVHKAKFVKGNGWKESRFPESASGEYLVLEIPAMPQVDGGEAAIAEIYLIDSDGKRLSREKWSRLASDSEDIENGNHTVDKIFDLQESTYWKAEPKDFSAHYIVINLGEKVKAAGLQYLPRMENGSPGCLEEMNVYLLETNPFENQ